MNKKVVISKINPLFLNGIAHRGYHNATDTENGLRAFQNALDHNLAIEFDVHLTKDNKLLVCHDFVPLNKFDITLPEYDTCGRQEAALDPKIDHKNSFRDANLDLTEEQVKKETARCLSCGASIVDPHKCIGCGICTTHCQFDAIHLFRDHPEMTNMRMGEDKIKGLGAYALKRQFKIIAHSQSAEAKSMRKQRKAYKKANKEFAKENPYTGNGYKE